MIEMLEGILVRSVALREPYYASSVEPDFRRLLG